MLTSLPNNILDLNYDSPRTIILVPSISLGGLTSQFLPGLNFWEERNLFYLACLKNPQTQFVVVLSEGIQECFILYCIDHVSKTYNLKKSDIQNRFTVIGVPSGGNQSLTKKILHNSEVISRISRVAIDGHHTVIDYWMVHDQEVLLANKLGLPYYGQPPGAFYIDSKSGARDIFTTLGIPISVGCGNLVSLQEVQSALQVLLEESQAETFILKINHEEGGNGLAKIPREIVLLPYQQFRERIQVIKDIPITVFEKELQKQKAVIEVYINAAITAFPSVKMEILADGTVRNIATHDQLLKDMVYYGSSFPADESYRFEVIKMGQKIGKYVSKLGARGIISIDFLATKNHLVDDWYLWGIEINARKGGTTHSYIWSKWLTQSEYDQTRGTLTAKSGEISYHSSEYFTAPGLENISPINILSTIKDAGLDYNCKKQAGIFVHMISTVPKFGKFGATIIGHSKEEITDYWVKLEQLLEVIVETGSNSSRVLMT